MTHTACYEDRLIEVGARAAKKAGPGSEARMTSPERAVLHLQRTAGNAAVVSLLRAKRERFQGDAGPDQPLRPQRDVPDDDVTEDEEEEEDEAEQAVQAQAAATADAPAPSSHSVMSERVTAEISGPPTAPVSGRRRPVPRRGRS